jgi:flagellin-specific chaperone FliS
LVNKKILIALPLLLILAAPVSALAESFTVTTNKDIYSADEKAIIVGVLPEDAPDGYAVLVKVTGPGGDCASQNILPGADNGFRSRPVSLDECGLGQFTILAFYADLETSSTFAISNSSQADAGSKLELRTLKKIILQALDVVNSRVKELIEAGYVLPEEVADKYSEGVSQASLALEAIEFSDAAEARRHMILAIQDFRAVLRALSEENIASFEQAEREDNSDVVGLYNKLERTYNRLQNVAEKNQVDKEDKFEHAAKLLSDARQMMEEGNYEGAEHRLGQVNVILEEIRNDLYDDQEDDERLASDTNATSSEDVEKAEKLIETAARYEEDALELLNETGANPTAATKLQEALSLVASARAHIDAQDLEEAREDLRAVYRAIEDAKDLIEHEGDDNSGESSDDDSNSNSGKGKGNDKEGEEDDEDDNDSGNRGRGHDDN